MKKTIRRLFNGMTRLSQDELNEQLREAAAKGHTKAAIALIERGADMEARDRDGWTALHLAMWTGHMTTALTLIARGADVSAKDANGMTPLDRAQSFGRPETARKLREVISLCHARKVKAVRLGKRWGP